MFNEKVQGQIFVIGENEDLIIITLLFDKTFTRKGFTCLHNKHIGDAEILFGRTIFSNAFGSMTLIKLTDGSHFAWTEYLRGKP